MTRARLLRLAGSTAAVALPIGILAVSYQLTGLASRAWQRRLTEGILIGTSVAYRTVGSMLMLSFVLGIAYLLMERRRKRRHPRLARGVLACGSALVGLLALEVSAAAWEAWSRRLPALPTRFDSRTWREPTRLVVIGGSSALGEPFRPGVSIGTILAWRLRQENPPRRFATTVLARLGASLKDMHEELALLERPPDVLVIYSGHNEFTARYEAQREALPLGESGGGWLDQIVRGSRRFPLGRLIARVVSLNRLDGPPPTIGRHLLIDPPQVSPAEYAEVLEDFARRLDAIVSWCDRVGCVPLLVIPPSNEGGLAPNRSTLPVGVLGKERAEVVARMLEAGKLETDQPDRAAGLYEAVVSQHPGFAEAHYRLGSLLQREGRIDEANAHYRQARDWDGLPIRCPTDFQDVYRRVASGHPSTILIDGPDVLRKASPTGVVDDHVIIDAHHPSFAGMVALADAAGEGLKRRGLFRWTGSALDPFDVAEQLDMDHARWAEACDRTKVHYQRIAGYRFDPRERLERAQDFARAKASILAGKAPEECGVVGLGRALVSSAER